MFVLWPWPHRRWPHAIMWSGDCQGMCVHLVRQPRSLWRLCSFTGLKHIGSTLNRSGVQSRLVPCRVITPSLDLSWPSLDVGSWRLSWDGDRKWHGRLCSLVSLLSHLRRLQHLVGFPILSQSSIQRSRGSEEPGRIVSGRLWLHSDGCHIHCWACAGQLALNLPCWHFWRLLVHPGLLPFLVQSLALSSHKPLGPTPSVQRPSWNITDGWGRMDRCFSDRSMHVVGRSFVFLVDASLSLVKWSWSMGSLRCFFEDTLLCNSQSTRSESFPKGMNLLWSETYLSLLNADGRAAEREIKRRF